jgi:hypothetical protein
MPRNTHEMVEPVQLHWDDNRRQLDQVSERKLTAAHAEIGVLIDISLEVKKGEPLAGANKEGLLEVLHALNQAPGDLPLRDRIALPIV